MICCLKVLRCRCCILQNNLLCLTGYSVYHLYSCDEDVVEEKEESFGRISPL